MVWIVAVTKPNSEAIAEAHLRRQGFEHYCPRFEERRPNSKPRVKPLFSRYIFVFIDKAWYCIKSTIGISNILMGDTGPEPLPAEVIEKLKRQTKANGLVGLEPVPKFAIGSHLKTTTGPFAGQLLIYEGMTARDRCRVLMDTLGRKVAMDLPEAELVAA
jgi:transcription antitermination factor NusG